MMEAIVFSSPRPNLVESDDGFSVEVLGRTGILYREGKRSMVLGSEVLAPKAPAGIAVWKSSIRAWNSPDQDEQIDEAKRAAILENIRRAIRFAGGDIEIIG
jgi:hypothetical protein